MLIIEENMLRLAKMQETLLKVSETNREENLVKYIKTVSEIDAKFFEYIIEKTKHIDEHNQSLEEEIEYLKEIQSLYNQLLDLQSEFRKNCETYGNCQLELSDLSILNIDYIISRINAIDGYLKNLKNIELNKVKIQKLSELLIEEEKKKITLDNKLNELDQSLKDGFGNVEGRIIVDNKLEYTNIILEYKKINFDFERLLNDEEYLKSSIAYIRNEKREISEKVKVAEVCYSNMPNYESKQILDEINIEDLKVKYKLTMLEIVELLTKKSGSYHLFIEKRKNMVDLIKYRLVCMESLGMKNSVDPFGRTKIKEQLEIAQSFTDNSKIVSDMMIEISDLNNTTEEMIFQNNGYLITINNTESIIKDRVSFNDIDITPVVSFDELLVKKEISDNQVVKIRNISSNFNMDIISQKTLSVIKRVNQMLNRSIPEVKKNVEIIPELVILPMTSTDVKEETVVDTKANDDSSLTEVNDNEIMTKVDMDLLDKTESLVLEDEKIDKVEEVVVPKEISAVDDVNISNANAELFSESVQLFETVTPFEEPALFIDRTDDESVNKIDETNTGSLQLDTTDFVNIPDNNDESEMLDDVIDTMPDVFWVTQDNKTDDKVDDIEELDNVLSFDEQINALLSHESSESNENVKTRRRVA